MKGLLLIHKNFIKDNRLIFILLICCLVICFVAIFFAYSNILCKASDNMVNLTFNQGISISKLEEDMASINSDNPIIDNYIIQIDNELDIYISYENNLLVMFGRFVESIDDIVIGNDLPYEIGETYIYQDNEYVVCGKMVNTYLHYDAVDHSKIIYDISLKINSSSSLNKANRILINYYNDSVTIDNSNKREIIISALYEDYYQMIIISIILATLILILIYNFFIERMREDLMLLRIFGMSKIKCQLFYYAEIVAFTLSLLLLSFILYLPIFYMFIRNYQIHFYDSYYLMSLGDVLLIFAIMIAIIISITIVKLKNVFRLENMRKII